MEGIQTIIFDLGGVLINLDYHKTNEELGKLGLADAFSKAKQIDIFNLLEEGKINRKEFFAEFRKLSNQNPSDQEILIAWNSILKDLPATRLDLLQRIQNQYQTFLFSNTNEMHIDEVYHNTLKEHGIPNLNHFFKKVYLSHELGIRKPKVEGFLTIVKENKLNPAQTLFIDDSIQHIEGAQKAGLRAEWLNLEQEDLHGLINRLNLLK